FNGPLHFRFPTPRPCDIAENNVVYGRLYRCAGFWQECPTIILLHGGRIIQDHHGSIGYRFGYPSIARRCNRAGFNAATLEAPYHFQRQPPHSGAMSAAYLRSAEAARRQSPTFVLCPGGYWEKAAPPWRCGAVPWAGGTGDC